MRGKSHPKIDAANQDKLTKLKQYCKKKNLQLFPISAVTGEGIEKLKFAMAEQVEALRGQNLQSSVAESTQEP